MGGCQNYDPFLGTLNIRCRIIIRIQKRDHNFDNHPYRNLLITCNLKLQKVGAGWSKSFIASQAALSHMGVSPN